MKVWIGLLLLAVCANAASFKRVKQRCLVIGQFGKVWYDQPVNQVACNAKCASHKRAECVWWLKDSPGKLLQATPRIRNAKNCKITGARGPVKFDIKVTRKMCKKICENHPKATCMWNGRVNLQGQ